MPNKNNLELFSNIRNIITCKNDIYEFTNKNILKNLKLIDNKCIKTNSNRKPNRMRNDKQI